MTWSLYPATKLYIPLNQETSLHRLSYTACNKSITMQYLFLCCFSISLLIFPNIAYVKANQVEDKIQSLPGQPKVDFDQYSGYVTVNSKHGRALFCWLTESPRHSASNLPLILWLNGGPGRSSIGYGAFEEIGPFRVMKNASALYLNKYAWNKYANLLFIESPAGVGFSYTNTSSDLLDTGDKRTAEDAFIFLVKWFERFPQYKHRDFYICGESYAGHYAPQLTEKVYNYMKSENGSYINLKGLMVGNPLINNPTDFIGIGEYWLSNALISEATYNALMKSCNFSASFTDIMKSCGSYYLQATQVEFGNIDAHSIYTPICANYPISNSSKHPRFKDSFHRGGGYDPCMKNYIEMYLNRADVQKAFHANTTNIPYPWIASSNVLLSSWKDSPNTVLPLYKELMAAGLRVWIYSGDTDANLPVTSTRLTIKAMNLTVKTPWYPWYLNNVTVGGRSEVYSGLAFATVRGAGHEVPLFQPARALLLFKSFLNGVQLPKSSPI